MLVLMKNATNVNILILSSIFRDDIDRDSSIVHRSANRVEYSILYLLITVVVDTLDSKRQKDRPRVIMQDLP